MKDLLSQLAAYNIWANQKLLEIILALPGEKQKQEVPSSFRSLYTTVFHMWDAESIFPKDALRKAGVVAPGVEMVPAKSAPVANDFRYCQNKIDSPTLERVTAAVHAAVSPAPKVVILPARLCTSVRHNHYELWLARSQ